MLQVLRQYNVQQGNTPTSSSLVFFCSLVYLRECVSSAWLIDCVCTFLLVMWYGLLKHHEAAFPRRLLAHTKRSLVPSGRQVPDTLLAGRGGRAVDCFSAQPGECRWCLHSAGGGADGRQTPTVTALPTLCMHAHARFPVIRCSSVCAPPDIVLHFPGKVGNRKELTFLPFKIETIHIDFL